MNTQGGEALCFVELESDGLVKRWRARPLTVVTWHLFAHPCASGKQPHRLRGHRGEFRTVARLKLDTTTWTNIIVAVAW